MFPLLFQTLYRFFHRSPPISCMLMLHTAYRRENQSCQYYLRLYANIFVADPACIQNLSVMMTSRHDIWYRSKSAVNFL
jgi:hypothetical protein